LDERPIAHGASGDHCWMDFQEVIRRRRMVRDYQPRPVPEELRERILANALRAPSAGHSQGWAFLVLEQAEDRERFWTAVTAQDDESPWSEGLRRAPLIVVALSHKQAYLDRYAEPDKGVTDRRESFWPVPYWDVDTGFAALLMLLTAVDTGLAACFAGIRPERVDAFRTAFGVPEPHRPVGVVTIGYRAPDVPSPSLRRGRRAVDDVVHRGRW
jgi:nitroreductase